MKLTKRLTIGFLFIGMITLIGCKKEDMSQYAKKSDLQNGNIDSSPKIENIDLTIHSYDWQWNSLYACWEYSYPHSSIYKGVLIGFVMNGQGKQALPYYDAQKGVTYGLVDYTFSGNIKVTYYSGNSTLAKPSNDTYVYFKIIPSSQIKPNVNYRNYSEVAKTYNLE